MPQPGVKLWSLTFKATFINVPLDRLTAVTWTILETYLVVKLQQLNHHGTKEAYSFQTVSFLSSIYASECLKFKRKRTDEPVNMPISGTNMWFEPTASCMWVKGSGCHAGLLGSRCSTRYETETSSVDVQYRDTSDPSKRSHALHFIQKKEKCYHDVAPGHSLAYRNGHFHRDNHLTIFF